MRNDHVLASSNAFPPFAALTRILKRYQDWRHSARSGHLGISHAVVSGTSAI